MVKAITHPTPPMHSVLYHPLLFSHDYMAPKSMRISLEFHHLHHSCFSPPSLGLQLFKEPNAFASVQVVWLT